MPSDNENDIVVYRAGSKWATPWEDVFIEGLRAHGIEPEQRPQSDLRPCGLAVIWAHRQTPLFDMQRAAGAPYLIMERGYVGDRYAWTSLGFDGLNGRARFPKADDGGARFAAHFADRLRPWRSPAFGDVAVIMGQVRGDQSIKGVDMAAWYAEAAANLKAEWGLPVVFRPHPLDLDSPPPVGCAVDTGPLEALLARTQIAAVYNSNSGVDAVLAGVPVIARDAGAMCRPVAARDWDHLHMPDRAAWAADLAFTQWTAPEISAGAAWEKLRGIAWDR